MISKEELEAKVVEVTVVAALDRAEKPSVPVTGWGSRRRGRGWC